MTSVAIKHPDKTRVIVESAKSSEGSSIVVPPKTTGTSKCWKAGWSWETSTAEGEDTLAGAEGLMEGVYVVVRSHGCEEPRLCCWFEWKDERWW
jgi:hypothetical protein